MADFYADSSVLIKRHVQETGSQWVQSLTDPNANHVIFTVQISQVEVVSGLSRRRREANLSMNVYTELEAAFLAAYRLYSVVSIQPIIQSRAIALLRQHPLRAYDAIQLAAALEANARLVAVGEPALIFLSADNNLLSAAVAEGLMTDNPNLHP